MSFPNPVSVTHATEASAVTPSDTTLFPPSHIYVGGAGNVNVLPAAEAGKTSPAAVLFTAPPVGSVLPVMCVRVLSTSTTATALVRVS